MVRALTRKRALCTNLFLAVLMVIASRPVPSQESEQEKTEHTKLPRPKRLDTGFQLQRDPATGELRFLHPEGPAVSSQPPAIRVGVNLVEVGCNVFGPGGNQLEGLTRDDFRIFEDGVEQRIAYFDASNHPNDPLHLALVFDGSPSVLRDESEMKQAARTLLSNLGPRDEVAVVAFAAHTFLVLPWSHNRAQLERAIGSVDVRRLAVDTGGSNIYEAVALAARQLFPNLGGRKAIVLLTDGQDSGLGLTWDPASAALRRGESADRLTFEDVARILAAQDVEVYIISTEPRPRVITAEWLDAHQNQMLVNAQTRELGVPAYTAYLAELVRRVGGRLYFLREMQTLANAYRQIAQTLRAQYTLGFYPSGNIRAGPSAPSDATSASDSAQTAARSGWRSLRVEVIHHEGAQVVHRTAYYVSAAP